MATIIDARDILSSKSLPFEGFFVDTNIIITFKDPFQVSDEDKYFSDNNILLREIIPKFKSDGGKCWSIYSTALEYYKYIQVNYTRKHTGKDSFSTKNFKELKENDSEFKEGWQVQMNAFDKVFRKNFPIRADLVTSEDCRETFDPYHTDFGDHLLYSTIKNVDKNFKCVFTNDKDFISYPDDLILLTTNINILLKR